MKFPVRPGAGFILIIALSQISVSQEVFVRFTKLQNPSAAGITDLTFDGVDRVYLCTTQGLYWTTDGGNSWKQPQSTLNGKSVTCVARVSSDVVFAGTPDSGLYRSTDGGLNWQIVQLDSRLTYGINCMLYRPNLGLACGVSDGVFWSGDTGKTWRPPKPMFRIPADGSLLTESANSLAANSVGTLLAWNGATSNVNSFIFASRDSGNSWTTERWMMGYSHYYDAVFAPQFDAIDPSTYFFVERFVYLLGGPLTTTLWSARLGVSGSMSSLYQNQSQTSWPGIVFFPDRTGRLFLVFNGVLFLSMDGGYGWTVAGRVNATKMAVDAANTMFCSTDTDLFRGNLSVLSVQTQQLSPSRNDLFQNYPNPFNPATEIRFSILARGSVSLKVFDMLGREVATLMDGIIEAGEHSVTWDAGELPSGVYFYRLVTDKSVQTRKMILLK